MKPHPQILLSTDVAPGGGVAAVDSSVFTPAPATIGQDVRDEIDALVEGGDAPAPVPTPKPAESVPTKPVAPAAKAPEPPPKDEEWNFNDEALDRSIPQTKKPEAKAPEAPAPTEDIPKTPKELRARFEAVNREKAELERLYGELKAKPAATVKVDDMPEYKAALARQKELEERYENTRRELSYHEVTSDPEFREKYLVPAQKALSSGFETIKGIKVGSDEDGNKRNLTEDDLLTLSNIPAVDRLDAIEKLVGERKAMYVSNVVERLANAREEYSKAKENARENAGKILEERRARMADSQAQMVRQFDEHLESFKARSPELYGFLPETDPAAKEYNPALVQTQRIVDLALKGNGNVTVPQRLKAQALMAARAIAVTPLMHRNGVLEAEVAALKEKLAKLEPKSPDIGAEASDDDSGEPAKPADDWRSDFDAAMAGRAR